jgi:sortase A
MRLRNLVLVLAALTMIVGLAACGQSSGGGGEQGGGNNNEQQQAEEPAPEQGQETEPAGQGNEATLAEVPEDTTLGLSIPKLDKNFDSIPTGRGDDTQLLTDNPAVHILYTGFPWENEANVYLAGHVEGYEGTPSYKAFDGLKQLENGDEIIVTDANGTEYVYEVYEEKIVSPTAVEMLDPVPGKNIVTLQTCEIVNVDADGNPDYSNTERYIVRGELRDVRA